MLLNKTKISEQEGYIVFAQAKNFFSRFLKKGYSHVYYIFNDGFNWCAIEPINSRLVVNILPYMPDDNVIEKVKRLSHVSHVIKIKTKIDCDNMMNRNPFFMLNCVNIIKYLCGIKCWCITPYQLYRFFARQIYTNKYNYGIDSLSIV